jgi:membrane protein YdbS with pleckstrin-like domain
MNQLSPQLIRVAVVLIVAFIASVLRYGFPPSEGWISFLGAMIFFIGVQVPIWFTTNRFKDK